MGLIIAVVRVAEEIKGLRIDLATEIAKLAKAVAALAEQLKAKL